MQADLLADTPLRTLVTPRQRGELAGEACSAKAKRTTGFDTEAAGAFILSYLKAHGPTPGEQLVSAAKLHGHVPHTDRAFGAVFKVLSRRKRIACLRADLPRFRGHATSGGKLWEASK